MQAAWRSAVFAALQFSLVGGNASGCFLLQVSATFTHHRSNQSSFSQHRSNLSSARFVFYDLAEPQLEPAYEDPPQRDEVCISAVVGGKKMLSDANFIAQIPRGRQAATSKGIIFAGLVRDIGTSGDRLFAALRRVGDAFAWYHIIVLENNSRDKTRTSLHKSCASNNTWCYLLDYAEMAKQKQDRLVPSRVLHLTTLRQAMLDKIRSLVTTSGKQWDYVMMFDGDIFNEGSKGFDPAMVLALLGHPSKPLGNASSEHPFDVVCANQMANHPNPGRYRDTFALKVKSFTEEQRPNDASDLYMKGNTLIPVKSCFSGLAVYSVDAIVNSQCNYAYEGEHVCEHVSLAKCLAQKGFGRMAIYPPLVVRTNDEGLPHEICKDVPRESSDVVVVVDGKSEGTHLTSLATVNKTHLTSKDA